MNSWIVQVNGKQVFESNSRQLAYQWIETHFRLNPNAQISSVTVAFKF
jgi:hypothetical protein